MTFVRSSGCDAMPVVGKILMVGSQGRQASGIQKESTVVGKGNTSGGKHSNSGFSREEAL